MIKFFTTDSIKSEKQFDHTQFGIGCHIEGKQLSYILD